MTKGSLFIITAASGTGKTSLVKQLIATTNDLAVSISHSTRQPRPGEIDGQHYHFVSREIFADMIKQGEFLEHAEVFENYYGTAQSTVEFMLSNGLDVILEIDWQGALQVQKLRPDATTILSYRPTANRCASGFPIADKTVKRSLKNVLPVRSMKCRNT